MLCFTQYVPVCYDPEGGHGAGYVAEHVASATLRVLGPTSRRADEPTSGLTQRPGYHELGTSCYVLGTEGGQQLRAGFGILGAKYHEPWGLCYRPLVGGGDGID